MPTRKITASNRARAAIAAVVAVTVGGFVTAIQGERPVPDDVALAIKVLQPWEGRHLTAYLDTLAKPPVWTICDGDTNSVRRGMVETEAGCNRRLATKLVRDYRVRLVDCFKGWPAMPLSWRGSMVSLSWNIGWSGVCNSTAGRLARAGKFRESCEAATAFNRAGGRVLPGLVNRREMGDAWRIGEAELCVSGLPS